MTENILIVSKTYFANYNPDTFVNMKWKYKLTASER